MCMLLTRSEEEEREAGLGRREEIIYASLRWPVPLSYVPGYGPLKAVEKLDRMWIHAAWHPLCLGGGHRLL